jgi:AcrR family transcriptional regulator/DNA-binding MarR family transcriptional regulator
MSATTRVSPRETTPVQVSSNGGNGLAGKRSGRRIQLDARGQAALGARGDAASGVGTDGHGAVGSAHEQVAGLQRARLLAAMVQATAELGAGSVSVSDVVTRSGVSRRTFYELFRDREDCLLAALEDALARAGEPVVRAYSDTNGNWASRLRHSLGELLAFLDSDPAARRLLIVESLAAGPRVLEERQRVLATLAEAIKRDGDSARAGVRRSQIDRSQAKDDPAPLTAEGIIGGVFSVIHARVAQNDQGPLLELLNPLMSMIVAPYLGPAAGRKELSKPVPESGKHQTRVVGNPMQGLEMRLTYRTLRVLMELGANPGMSNRQIGEAAGMTDQGQVSKLLSRLDRIGLIENTAGEPGRGGPNAWTLTPRGRQLEQLVHERTTSDGTRSTIT